VKARVEVEVQALLFILFVTGQCPEALVHRAAVLGVALLIHN